ncbi:hypothetical protein HMPREF1639_07065 [Peptostreptococcus sp. MV1]|uniref:hypothetical protein n=1 Tax=Peptostreptococcus sp. MV1 TaxID=1219626 RepID=UPI00050E2663|nr:hypothetical protein [Peptostreptococcus sp. MV1]KGF11529.1 hypothetical protein HMPREF1639_07065 [Peptostreptococcus sp. MV1]
MSQAMYRICKNSEGISIACQKYRDGSDYISRLGGCVDNDMLTSALAFVEDCSDEDFTGKDLWNIFFKVLRGDYNVYEYEE